MPQPPPLLLPLQVVDPMDVLGDTEDLLTTAVVHFFFLGAYLSWTWLLCSCCCPTLLNKEETEAMKSDDPLKLLLLLLLLLL